MEEKRHRTRDAEDDLVTTLRAIVHEEVKARTSSWPKKNGDGLLGYIGRLITPERIALTFLLVYQIGGRVQQFQVDMKDVTSKTVAVSQKVDDLTAHVEKLTLEQLDAKSMLESQDLQIGKLQTQTTALRQQLGLTITRGEFKEAIEQRILPRLDRIERQ